MNIISHHTKTIFLADDDIDDVSLFEDAIKSLSHDINLIISNDGEQLIKNLQTKIPPLPHAIFLDLNMPLKSGYECLAEIRENNKLTAIPIVIFSTSSSQNSIDITYSLGANYFICKPPSFLLLKKAIETILSLDSDLLAVQPSRENYFLNII